MGMFSVLKGKGQFDRGDFLQLFRGQTAEYFADHQALRGHVHHRQIAVDAIDAADAKPNSLKRKRRVNIWRNTLPENV